MWGEAIGESLHLALRSFAKNRSFQLTGMQAKLLLINRPSKESRSDV